MRASTRKINNKHTITNMNTTLPCPEPLPQLLTQATNAQAWPGAVLGLANKNGETRISCSGKHQFADDATPVAADHLFDLASLTKVIATTTLAMIFYEQGSLVLDEPLTTYLPDFAQAETTEQSQWRQQITIRHLLAHCTGLPAGRQFYLQHPEITDPKEQSSLVTAVPLLRQPGQQSIYSDLSMMILAQVLTKIGGGRLDVLTKNLIFAPLGMRQTTFNPPPEWHAACLTTEQKSPTSPVCWQGVVHDENARWLGGVAGHAGLFSNVPDLLRFATMFLNNGQWEGHAFLSPETVALFTRRANLVAGSSRCLGWDSPSGDLPMAGINAPADCFGHGGFTGTSIWLNPQAGMAVVLLTNAVHPQRQCKERGLSQWRRQLYQEAWRITKL